MLVRRILLAGYRVPTPNKHVVTPCESDESPRLVIGDHIYWAVIVAVPPSVAVSSSYPLVWVTSDYGSTSASLKRASDTFVKVTTAPGGRICSRSQRSDESTDGHLILLAVPLRQREWMAADCGWRHQRHHPPYGLWSFRFNFDFGMPVRRFSTLSLSIESPL